MTVKTFVLKLQVKDCLSLLSPDPANQSLNTQQTIVVTVAPESAKSGITVDRGGRLVGSHHWLLVETSVTVKIAIILTLTSTPVPNSTTDLFSVSNITTDLFSVPNSTTGLFSST